MASAPSDAGPKKRLVIKQMVLENFKSYAGAGASSFPVNG